MHLQVNRPLPHMHPISPLFLTELSQKELKVTCFRHFSLLSTTLFVEFVFHEQVNYNNFNPLKRSGVRQLHLKVFNAIQV